MFRLIGKRCILIDEVDGTKSVDGTFPEPCTLPVGTALERHRSGLKLYWTVMDGKHKGSTFIPSEGRYLFLCSREESREVH